MNIYLLPKNVIIVVMLIKSNMKKYLLFFSVIGLIGFIVSGFYNSDATSRKNYKTKHVIILVLDGPRWSETFGDPTYKYVPNLKNVLAPQGVFFNDFANDGPTYTISGHTALTTGVYQRMENSGKEIPKHPSIFQYYLKQYSADKRKAWILASKGKLNVIGYTKSRGWVREFYPSLYAGINGSGTGYPSDTKLYPIFKEILLKERPVITLINLLDIDAWAHQGHWDNYTSSIVQNDKLSLDLWNTIQSDSILKDKTTLFITNDHGRHLEGTKNGFISHGDNCAGCRKISLIALGPDFKVNAQVNNHYDLLDINATAAEMLNVNMPTSKGEVIWEMFKD